MSKFSIRNCKFLAIRSRGPGGQNVNKSSTGIRLIWSFAEDPLLSSEEIDKIRKNLKDSEASFKSFESDEFRDQIRNKKACLEKLNKFLHRCLKAQKVRKKTLPTLKSQLKRQESKKIRSQTKNFRRKIGYES
jgi:ribosome-associated protein